MATLTPQMPALQARVDQLEKQVAGLMITVSMLHDKYHLQSWKIPRPDQFIQPEQVGQGKQRGAVQTVPGQVDSQARSDTAPKQPAVTQTAPEPKDLTQLETYQYSPLNPDASEIRLISILESKRPDEPVRCEISTVSLPSSIRHPDAPRFMPLSYTWGGLAKTETIVLNERAFIVTRNLHVALRHFRNAAPAALRPPGYPASIPNSRFGKSLPTQWWVDAICINQNDLDERKSQVGLMTRLYRMARIAHIWLGEAADDSARAMGLIHKLARKASDQEQKEIVEREPGQTHRLQGPGTVPERIPAEPAEMPDDEKDRNYQALVQIFKRDWFSRVWILQEMALPQNVTVHCGDDVCSWDQMMKTASLLVYVADEYKLPNLQRLQRADKNMLVSFFQRVEQLSRLRNETQSMLTSKDPYLPLSRALLFARNSSSTDLRDKVFAILPLVSPDKTRLVADYRRSPEEVYKETARAILTNHLDFLSACQYTEGGNNGLPSWVPDFSQPHKYYPMLMIVGPTKSGTSEDPIVTYLPEKSALTVRGYILDAVSLMCEALVTTESSRDDVQQVKSEWGEFYARNAPRAVGGMQAMEHLWNYHGGRAPYSPLYKGAYVGGKGRHLDLSVRALCRHLVTSWEPSELDESKMVGWDRNLFVGRRLVKTEGSHCGLVPAAARPGDKICKLQGSEIIYILRESSPQHFLVIGDSYFPGNFSDYQVSTMYLKPIMGDICLV